MAGLAGRGRRRVSRGRPSRVDHTVLAAGHALFWLRVIALGASFSARQGLVPLIGNVTLGVGALSYAQQFNITAVADRDACPDLDVFVASAQDELPALAAAALVSPGRS